MKKYFGLAALGFALVLAGCSSDENPDSSTDQGAASSIDGSVAMKYGLAEKPVRQVIDSMDATAKDERIETLHASVTPNELILTDLDTEEKESLTIPEDQFYLSFAPYINETHECYYHSLTTCTGELQNTDMDVSIKSNGEVIVDETMTSADNGFIGVWLPKGLTDATLEVAYEGKSVSVPISTDSDDDPTCLTTPVKLA